MRTLSSLRGRAAALRCDSVVEKELSWQVPVLTEQNLRPGGSVKALGCVKGPFINHPQEVWLV